MWIPTKAHQLHSQLFKQELIQWIDKFKELASIRECYNECKDIKTLENMNDLLAIALEKLVRALQQLRVLLEKRIPLLLAFANRSYSPACDVTRKPRLPNVEFLIS